MGQLLIWLGRNLFLNPLLFILSALHIYKPKECNNQDTGNKAMCNSNQQNQRDSIGGVHFLELHGGTFGMMVFLGMGLFFCSCCCFCLLQLVAGVFRRHFNRLVREERPAAAPTAPPPPAIHPTYNPAMRPIEYIEMAAPRRMAMPSAPPQGDNINLEVPASTLSTIFARVLSRGNRNSTNFAPSGIGAADI